MLFPLSGALTPNIKFAIGKYSNKVPREVTHILFLVLRSWRRSFSKLQPTAT